MSKVKAAAEAEVEVEAEAELVFEEAPPPRSPGPGPEFKFLCDRYPKLLVAPSGKILAHFDAGVFVTTDEVVARKLRALNLDDVTEES